MFQRGTGERFKYKDAVKAKHPDAMCKKFTYGPPHFSSTFTVYIVKTAIANLSGNERSAEKAWEQAWLKVSR